MITRDGLIEVHKEEEKLSFTVDDKIKISDDEIRINILREIGVEPKCIGGMEKNRRNEILRELKNIYSIRQLERLTGVSRGVIHKC